MNDYQKERAEERAYMREQLAPVAEALGNGWQLDPDPEEQDAWSRWHYFSNGQGRQIVAEVVWNKPDRFEFRALGWPTYADPDGRTMTVDPSTMWNPKESRPVISCARSRTPEAIARDIERRLLPEYERLYTRAEEIAADRQKSSDGEAELIDLLWKATRDTHNEHRQADRPYFVREIEGGPLTIEYRSPGSVKIDLSAREMAAVIEFLRDYRAKEAKDAA
ncbi:MAG: hypothetical protein AMJ72_00055 [Acidithiobacillales bacterium SM1_46]|nr:MAG: hypothetical protein AMJ72_00055 [Acidithiobacillales bacterium SM1_46]